MMLNLWVKFFLFYYNITMCFYCDREVKGNPQTWWYENYVCWNCRGQNGLKNDPILLKNNKIEHIETGRICYRCHNPMVNVGFKFKTPKKSDLKKWKELEKTWENQYVYLNGIKNYVGPKKRIVQQSF